MNSTIEKYLNGELTGEDLEVFEKRMLEDVAFKKEVEETGLMLEHLKNQMLRERIQKITSQEPSPGNHDSKSTFIPKWFWGIAAVLSVLLVSYLFQIKKTLTGNPADVPSINDTLQGTIKTPPGETIDSSTLITPEETPKPAETPPIAENRFPNPVTPPANPQNFRSLDDSSDAWETFLQSVWKTDFQKISADFKPPYDQAAQLLRNGLFADAYLSLATFPTKSDTLNFLRGYTFLEMKEGNEALTQFDAMQDATLWKNHTDWYRVLALLLRGEVANARKIAASIKVQNKHPFRPEAIKVLASTKE